MTRAGERAGHAAGPRWRPEGVEPPKGLLEEGSLWVMIAAPTVWAAHFLVCYWVAAVWCAKVTEGAGPLGPVRWAVAILTVAALALIGALIHRARTRYEGRFLIDEDLTRSTEAERTRFLGHATLLLAGLSAVAVVIDALPVVVFDTCF
jgi:hypothetical protein